MTPYAAVHCADCDMPIGHDEGPSDGWQLEDGRTVCHACAAKDLRRVAKDTRHELVRQQSAGMWARLISAMRLARRKESTK
jgi:hypothetical protein